MQTLKRKLPRFVSTDGAYQRGFADAQRAMTSILVERIARAHSAGYRGGYDAGRYAEVVK